MLVCVQVSQVHSCHVQLPATAQFIVWSLELFVCGRSCIFGQKKQEEPKTNSSGAGAHCSCRARLAAPPPPSMTYEGDSGDIPAAGPAV